MIKFVVHSMGKCGSRSVVQTLKMVYDPRHVHHSHYLCYPQRPPDKIVRTELEGHFGGKVVISVVREPIKRNLSAYWQNYVTKDTIPSEQDFIQRYPHRVPHDFMFGEFQDYWGTEIPEFDKELGYVTWIDGRNRFMVFDIGKAQKAWIKGLTELDISGIINGGIPPLMKVGVTRDEGYLAFLKELHLPFWYIDQMYSSRYAKTFWPDYELSVRGDLWRREDND